MDFKERGGTIAIIINRCISIQLSEQAQTLIPFKIIAYYRTEEAKFDYLDYR